MSAYTVLNDQSLSDAVGRGLVSIVGGYYEATLSGNLVLTAEYPNVLKLDAGGGARDVTLLAEASADGVFMRIINASDAAENLVVKDDGGATIGTINQNEQGEFYCDGTAWRLLCMTTIALT